MLKIAIHDNFLEEDIFKSCCNRFDEIFSNKELFNNILDKKLTEYDATVNIYHWIEYLVRDSSNIYRVRIKNDDLLFKYIEDTVKHKLDYSHVKNIWFTYFTQNSHIPWHDDGDKTAGITIYLNETWNKNDGGAFLFEDKIKNLIYACYPFRNRAIEQVGGVHHAMSCITSKADVRKTIQIFL